jgi:two-component system NtrC family sensor kinase
MNTPLASLAAGLRSVHRACAAAAASADREDGSWKRVLALLEDLTTETSRCQRVTESLLLYSRQLKGRIEAAELHAIVRGAIDDLASRRDIAGIEVVHEAPGPGTPEVQCDPDQLRLVLLNVLANAVDTVREARRQKGRVHVSVRVTPAEDGVELHVKDNGVGVPPEVAERLFDPFFTTKPVGQGTGLGLAVSRGLLDGMGATIAIESHPGRGADVVVRLRTARAEVAELKPPASSQGSPSV